MRSIGGRERERVRGVCNVANEGGDGIESKARGCRRKRCVKVFVQKYDAS